MCAEVWTIRFLCGNFYRRSMLMNADRERMVCNEADCNKTPAYQCHQCKSVVRFSCRFSPCLRASVVGFPDHARSPDLHQSLTTSTFVPATVILITRYWSSTQRTHCAESESRLWSLSQVSDCGPAISSFTRLSSRSTPFTITFAGPISSRVALPETCWRGTRITNLPVPHTRPLSWRRQPLARYHHNRTSRWEKKLSSRIMVERGSMWGTSTFFWSAGTMCSTRSSSFGSTDASSFCGRVECQLYERNSPLAVTCISAL